MSCSNWTLATPAGAGNTTHGYAFNAFTLQETPATAQPVAILAQPNGAVVREGEPAVFTVQASGWPIFYERYKDGAPIPNGTKASFTIANTTTNDAGTYFVVVSNQFNSVISRNAILTVLPRFMSYAGGTITEEFDSIGPTGANTPAGWYVGWHNGYPPGTAGAVVRTTSLTVNDGNTAASGAIAGFNCGTSGGLNRSLGLAPTSSNPLNGTNRFVEVQIRNDSGQSLNTLNVTYVGKQWRTSSSTANQNFTNRFQFGTNGTDYIFMGPAFDYRAPVTSPADTPLNGDLPPNYTTDLGGSFSLPAPVPPRATIHLRWLDVNDPPTDPVLAIDNFRFSAFTVTEPPIIVSQPQDQRVVVGTNVAFAVGANGPRPFSFQWYHNSVLLAGATNSLYHITNATRAAEGAYAVVVTNPYGAATSRVATLTVDYFTISGVVWDDQNANGEWERRLLKGRNPDVVFVIDTSSSTLQSFLGRTSATSIVTDSVIPFSMANWPAWLPSAKRLFSSDIRPTHELPLSPSTSSR